MKYFIPIFYLAVGIIMPIAYVNIMEINRISQREVFLLIVIFLFCTFAGLELILINRKGKKVEVVPEPPKPEVAKPTAEFKKRDKPLFKRGRLAPETQNIPFAKTPGSFVLTQPPAVAKPDLEVLIEEIKNYTKLESWLMALQKTNELIHYYPDSPDAEKIRGSLGFLIQKTQESRRR